MSELYELEDKIADMVVGLISCNKYHYYIDYKEKELCVKNCNGTVILRVRLNLSCDRLDNYAYMYDQEGKSLYFEKQHLHLQDVVRGKCEQIKKEREHKLLKDKASYLAKWSAYLKTVGGLK